MLLERVREVGVGAELCVGTCYSNRFGFAVFAFIS
jgi:hypothetical protein